MVELSGTSVPPNLLDEVQERRSGACRGAGAVFRLVPAEIKHWFMCVSIYIYILQRMCNVAKIVHSFEINL